MASDKCVASGRKRGKPCQKQYVSTRRSLMNAERWKRRHAKRLAKFAARRAAGKRNAYVLGRNGRGHRKAA